MHPTKAYALGVNPDEIRIETYSGRHRGDWIVFVQDGDRPRILTQGGIFQMCKWAQELRALYESEAA